MWLKTCIEYFIATNVPLHLFNLGNLAIPPH